MSSKRSLDCDRAVKVAENAEWPKDRQRLFIGLVRLSKAKNQEHRRQLIESLNLKVPKFMELQMDHFEAMSDWRYFAVLELTAVRDFSSKPEWIARRLGLTTIEIRDIIARLRRLGLLDLNDDEEISKANPDYATSDDVPSEAIKQYHRQMLDKAKTSLSAPIEKREFRNITVAIDTERLPEIKERIRAFEDEMNSYMEVGTRESVYQLSIQLFQLDRESK